MDPQHIRFLSSGPATSRLKDRLELSVRDEFDIGLSCPQCLIKYVITVNWPSTAGGRGLDQAHLLGSKLEQYALLQVRGGISLEHVS